MNVYVTYIFKSQLVPTADLSKTEIFSPFGVSRMLFKSLLVLYPSGSQDQLVRVGMNVQSIQHPHS